LGASDPALPSVMRGYTRTRPLRGSEGTAPAKTLNGSDVARTTYGNYFFRLDMSTPLSLVVASYDISSPEPLL